MNGGPQPFDAERERLRLQRRAELTGLLMPLGREDRDPMDPAAAYQPNPWFDWPTWKASVPAYYGHGALRAHRYGLILDDGTVIRTYNRYFAPHLAIIVRIVRPLLAAHRIEVPLWYEIQTRPDWASGMCNPKMSLDGQEVGNAIALSSREQPIPMIFAALHEISHATPELDSDLDPNADCMGHLPIFRKRFGFLLNEFLESETPLTPSTLHHLRFLARDSTWGAPIHPLGWRWDEVPVRRS